MKSVFSIKNIYFVSAFALFIYLILRAAFVPPVHDEGSTFMHYIQRDEWMPFKAHWDANNHILNSFLSAQFFKIFGQGLIPLRLASLLFFPLYAIYVFKISKFLQNKLVQIFFLFGMLGAHNLMEYFGYSRGYAMSMALLMAALYFVIRYLKDFNIKKLWPFYIFSILALIANLTLFNSILLLNGFLILTFLLKNKSWLLKFIYVSIAIFPIIGAAILSLEMKKIGLLYYGSDKGFYEVTVWSLVMLIYDSWVPAIAIFFIILSGLAVVFLGAARTGGKISDWLFSNRWFFAWMFIGNIIATILLQLIMKVNYPEDRTAMYFYFFLVLFFCFALDEVKINSIRKFAFIWILLPIHFIFNINLTHSSYWWYEHLPESFYTNIKSRIGNDPEKVSIGGYALMDMIWAYYNHKTGGQLNDIQTADYPSFYYDYLLLYDDNNNAYAEDFYTKLWESPISHIRVLERKEKVQLKFIRESFPADRLNNTDEYINFLEDDSLRFYKNICIDFKTHFQNSDPFFFGMITLGSFVGEERGLHENQEFHLFRTEWNKGYDFHHRIYIQNLSPNATRVMMYLWNPKHQKVNLTNTKVKVYYW